MEITKQIFESFIPASIEPTGYVWAKMESYIKAAKMSVINDFVGQVHTDIESGSDVEYFCRKAICLRAFVSAIPSLDIILTANGFGITNGNNIAPASKERVENLTKSIRRDFDVTIDVLISLLYNDSILGNTWRQTMAHKIIIFVLWRIEDFQRVSGKSDATRSDMIKEYPNMHIASQEIEKFISKNYLSELVNKTQQNNVLAVDEPIIEQLKDIYGLAITKQPFTKNLANLLNFIDNDIDNYPTYKNSSEYAARKAPKYENKKEHATYWF